MTWPRTIADFPRLFRKYAVHPADLDTSKPTTTIYAPCCGRRTPADTVVDLRGLKTEISGANHLPKRNHDWACDGCLHLLILDDSNHWTRPKLFRALGAPASVIRHERARELQIEAEAAAGDDEFKPDVAYENAHASLPADVRELPGTEPPDA